MMRMFKRPVWSESFAITDISDYSYKEIYLPMGRRTALFKDGKYYAVYCLYTEEQVRKAVHIGFTLELALMLPVSKVKYLKKVV